MKNEIHSYLHCRKCVAENLKSTIEAGITPHGIQVWCSNHDTNIVLLTPEGLQKMIAAGPKCDVCDASHEVH